MKIGCHNCGTTSYITEENIQSVEKQSNDVEYQVIFIFEKTCQRCKSKQLAKIEIHATLEKNKILWTDAASENCTILEDANYVEYAELGAKIEVL